MKIKDPEKVSCKDCPIRINGHCYGLGYETCTALDPEIDIEQWLKSADDAIKEYEKQKKAKEGGEVYE